MKRKFSTHWLSSKQPRKQRKYRHNAPLHLKHSFLSAHLSKPLREKHGKRSLPLRKGDEVLVMRGNFKRKKAKINSVDLKSSMVTLENIQRTKKDGTKVNVYFHPSKLQIQTLDLEDKKRIKKPKEKQNASKETKSNN
ncbi:MAG: 50S ribosomal protein L24 [Nanoarchaeota archaeon]